MLSHLSVRHLAVVEDLAIDFDSGMTSLTGETGAGKSILVDALGLVLGDRADSGMIRYGQNRAEIEASFDISHNPLLQQWLIDNELDDDNECHLRRTLSKEGASRAYINGRSVPIAQLRVISEHSIDIHGQHAHQSLIRPETQRSLLDTVAGNAPLLSELSQTYKEWQSTRHALQSQQAESEQQAAQRELLQYQVDELSAFELTDQRINDLIQQQQKLANASQLLSAAQSGLYLLNDQEQGAAYSLITQVLHDLEPLAEVEPQFANIIETLNSAAIQLDEANNDLRHYLDNTELDPQLLDGIENELSNLHQLARKHHVEIEALPAHFEALNDQLSQLTQQEQHTEALEQQLQSLEASCLALCEQLRQRRMAACDPLAQEITATIQQLAIPGGQVSFDIKAMAEGQFNETGADHIRLLVSTNPGQAAGELGKVASGGELARISLAIQVVTAGTRHVPTLVFDEVDVGIGGGIAEIVGQHLRELGETQQVICITHLPQVAAQAHQQIQVNKRQSDDTTSIELIELSASQRVEEIARMLGGVKITETSLEHAQEMLRLTK